MECGGQWATVKEELQAVVESSELGKNLYGYALLAIVQDEVGDFIDKEVNKFLKEDPDLVLHLVYAIKSGSIHKTSQASESTADAPTPTVMAESS